jgi:hypothetical protein
MSPERNINISETPTPARISNSIPLGSCRGVLALCELGGPTSMFGGSVVPRQLECTRVPSHFIALEEMLFKSAFIAVKVFRRHMLSNV